MYYSSSRKRRRAATARASAALEEHGTISKASKTSRSHKSSANPNTKSKKTNSNAKTTTSATIDSSDNITRSAQLPVYTGYSDLKPREEGDLEEYYPDLDINEPLSIKLDDTKETNHSEPQQDDQLNEIINRVNKPSFRKIPTDIQDHLKEDDIIDDVVLPLRLSKGLGKFGFNNDPHIAIKADKSTYSRPHNSKNGLIKNTLVKDDKFQVLYDMDEQDYIFLKSLKNNLVDDITNINKSSNHQNTVKSLLSFELFEIIITFLEIQIYFTEKLLPPKVKDPYVEDERAMLRASLYGSDDGIGSKPEEDQPCAVCNSSECDPSNAIIFCDGCNIAVHQECYGVAIIPEGSWLCRKCLISRDKNQKCLFCPSITGAFKQLDNGYWGHVICTLWINELYFANPIYMEPIEGFLNIPKSRWRLVCYICKQKTGACIQCCNKNCFLAYHATCARRSNLYMNLNKGIQGAINDKATVVSYCHTHSSKAWKAVNDVEKGIQNTRLYFQMLNKSGKPSSENNIDLLQNKVNVTQREFNLIKSTKNSLFKWKTKKESFIIPEIFVTRLISFFKHYHIIDTNNEIMEFQAREITYEICKYWTLKREYRNNIPLIKRLDSTLYGQFTSEEINERFKFLNILNQDINNLLDISNSILNRSKLQSKSNDSFLDIIDLVCFPVNQRIKESFDKLMEKYPNLIKFDSNININMTGGLDSDFKDLETEDVMKEDTNVNQLPSVPATSSHHHLRASRSRSTRSSSFSTTTNTITMPVPNIEVEDNEQITSFEQLRDKVHSFKYTSTTQFTDDFQKLGVYILQNKSAKSPQYRFFKKFKNPKVFFKKVNQSEESILEGLGEEIDFDELVSCPEPNYSVE